jgi:hypothetical protein
MNGQLYNLRLGDQQVGAQSPQKSVNLLPEIPAPTSRKLNEREQRDCEVIGIHFRTYFICFRLLLQATNQSK